MIGDDGGEASPAIEVSHLKKRYGSVTALAGCDLRVEKGGIVGLLGENGAGKTTLMRILLGLVKADSGGVSVLGGKPGSSAVAARIGATIEGSAFYPWLTGRRNLAALHAAGGERLPAEQIERVLARVGLADAGDRRVSGYSQGMRQRLALAFALVHGPDLLILDEPANGLDPRGMADLRSLLQAERDRGCAVLLSSHLLHEVEQSCDSVVLLHQGRIRARRSVRPEGGAPAQSLEEFYLTAIGPEA
jgi:ABC-2 type transport system ATP-binding protein